MSLIVVAMADLFFATRVIDAAKKAGREAVLVRTFQKALSSCHDGAGLLILDLACVPLRPLDLIAQLKADPATSSTRIVAFVPHVQTELRAAAEAAGCDEVFARSTFAESLPEILAGSSSANVG